MVIQEPKPACTFPMDDISQTPVCTDKVKKGTIFQGGPSIIDGILNIEYVSLKTTSNFKMVKYVHGGKRNTQDINLYID